MGRGGGEEKLFSSMLRKQGVREQKNITWIACSRQFKIRKKCIEKDGKEIYSMLNKWFFSLLLHPFIFISLFILIILGLFLLSSAFL